MMCQTIERPFETNSVDGRGEHFNDNNDLNLINFKRRSH